MAQQGGVGLCGVGWGGGVELKTFLFLLLCLRSSCVNGRAREYCVVYICRIARYEVQPTIFIYTPFTPPP